MYSKHRSHRSTDRQIWPSDRQTRHKGFGSTRRSRRAFWSTIVVIGILIIFTLYASPTPKVLEDLTDLADLKSDTTASDPTASDPADDHSPHPVVRLKNGTYRGFHNADIKMDFFKGVRYAQPPVGSLRYQTAQSLNTTWSTPRPAEKEGPGCIGFENRNDHNRGSEDCLFLNVVRPAGYSRRSLPVVVYIHGGSFIAGTASEGTAQPWTLVKNAVDEGKPMIFVSIQYRLSVFGFLYSQEIRDEGLGNLGIRDQRKALQWVQENIASFGGDSSRVTIYGSSAGSISAGFHLLAHGGRDDRLFRGAIMSSGSPQNYETFRSLSFYKDKFSKLLKAVGCEESTKPLECLRRVDASRIITAHLGMDTMTWKPVIDGDVLPDRPSKLLDAGKFVRVPIITGVNTDEGLTWAFDGIKHIQTEDDLRKYLENPTRENPRIGATSDAATRMLAAYPDDPCQGLPEAVQCTRIVSPGLGAQWQRFGALMTDYEFQAPRRHLCRSFAKAGVPAYSYRFNAASPERRVDQGVLHSDEKRYFWHHTKLLDLNKMPPNYYVLMKLMSSSIASFVTDLDPNTYKSRPSSIDPWPVYKVDKPNSFVFNASKSDSSVTSGVERDTFRLEGIDVLISLFEAFNR